jgi:hypothetical protein
MDHLQKNTAEKERTQQQTVLTVDSNIIRPDIPRIQVTYDDNGLPVFLDPKASLNQQLNVRFGQHWAKETAGIVANFGLTAAATFVPDGAAILPFITGTGKRLAIAGAAVATKVGLKAGGAYAQQVLTDGEEFSLAGYGKQFKKALVVPSNWVPASGTSFNKSGTLSIDLHAYKKVLSSAQPKYGENNFTNVFGTKFLTGFGNSKSYFPTEIKGSTTPLALGYVFEKKIANYAIFGTGHHGGGHGEVDEYTSADAIEASPYRNLLTQEQIKKIYEVEEYYKWNESLYHPKNAGDVLELVLRRPASGFKRVLLDDTIIPWTETVMEESNAHIKEITKNTTSEELFQVNPYGMGPANMVQAQLQSEYLKQAGAWLINTVASGTSSTLGWTQKFVQRAQNIAGLAIDKIGYYIDEQKAEELRLRNEAIAREEKSKQIQKQKDAEERKRRGESAARIAKIASEMNTKVVTWKINGRTVAVRIDIPVAESTGNVNMSKSAFEMKAKLFKNNISNQKVSNPLGVPGERSNPFRPR